MENYYKEITSDSKIRKICQIDNSLEVIVELYTENSIKVVFKEFLAYTVSYFWQGDIEGFLSRDASILLNDTRAKTYGDEAKIDGLHSFQFLTPSEKTALEVIAKSVEFTYI